MNTGNPVVQQAAGVTAFLVVFKSILVYFRAMGWIELEEERYQATVAFVETVIPIVVVWGAAFWAMRKVTPLSDPRDTDGTPLSGPSGEPTIAQMDVAIQMNKEDTERRIQR